MDFSKCALLLLLYFKLCGGQGKNDQVLKTESTNEILKSVPTNPTTIISTSASNAPSTISKNAECNGNDTACTKESTSTFSTTKSISLENNSTTESANKTLTEPTKPTILFNSTEEQNETKNDTNIEKIAPRKSKPAEFKHEVCTCDLQLNYCDINCCCDNDCSWEKKQIFDHCSATDFGYVDRRFCNYYEYIYKNNTPYKWERNNNGLFCIIRSNMPSQYSVQISQPLKTVKQLKPYQNSKKSWPNIQDLPEDSIERYLNSSKLLKYGEDIWFIRDSSEATTWSFPVNFDSNLCLLRAKLKFLENFSSKCSQMIIDEDNEALSAFTYFKNILIISNPAALQENWKNETLEKCPNNVCIKITPYVCDEHFENCENVTETSSKKLNISCDISIFKNEVTCTFVVKKAFYKLYHNETKGITKVDLFLQLANVTYSLSDKRFEFVQEYRAHFYWENHVPNVSASLSGNPGYVAGKPILVAKRVRYYEVAAPNGANASAENTAGNATTIVSKLSRNSSNAADNFLVLPKNVRSKCVLSNGTFETVQFGANSLTKCNFAKAAKVNFTGVNSANETCRTIQKEIFNLWSIESENVTSSDKFVGNFGNADLNKESDWSEVFIAQLPFEFLNQTFGETIRSEELFCYNLTRSLKIDIFFAKIDMKHLRNQHKILATSFEFGTKLSHKFKRVSSETLLIDVPLTVQVMFHDITGVKKRKFIDPPSFEIKLPKDFFYPFTNLRNNCNCCSFNAFLIIFVCTVFFFILI